MTEHNPESNINESMINDNPHDKLASDDAAAEAHEPGEAVENAPEGERLTAEKLGETARKVATETAYAAAGFAGLVGEKAKAFYDEQKKQYSDAHPDEDGPSAKAFLDQLSEQLNRFADDLTRSYKDLAERGRDVVQRGNQAKTSTKEAPENDGETPLADDAVPFSSDLSEDVSESEPQNDDVLRGPEKQDGIL